MKKVIKLTEAKAKKYTVNIEAWGGTYVGDDELEGGSFDPYSFETNSSSWDEDSIRAKLDKVYSNEWGWTNCDAISYNWTIVDNATGKVIDEGEYSEGLEESLTEAHLDYSTQKRKMSELEHGAYKNIAAMSDEKLRFNRNVCQQENYTKALDGIEDEMVRRGLITYADTRKAAAIRANANNAQATANSQTTNNQITFTADDFDVDTAGLVNIASPKDVIERCMALTGTVKHLLKSLIFAICLKKPADYITALQNFLTINCSYSIEYLKKTIQSCLSNQEILDKIKIVIQSL